MIYTMTLNPSLDYIVDVVHFKTGQVNRAAGERITPGGKGINVSIVLKNLGVESTAFGFLAGFTGEEIERRLKEKGIVADMIRVKTGISRINCKLRSDQESEINGMGPSLGKDELRQMYEKLEVLADGDYLVLAGSIPASAPDTLYRDIMSGIRKKGKKVKVVVDAAGDQLMKVLEYQPFLIKPNNHELGEIFGVKPTERKDVIPYAKNLREKGARNVLVSLAGKGAVFVGENGNVYESEAPAGKVVNSVGAGDSMIAGFLAEYLESGDEYKAFYTGLCTGSASAFSEELATREEVERIDIGALFPQENIYK